MYGETLIFPESLLVALVSAVVGVLLLGYGWRIVRLLVGRP